MRGEGEDVWAGGEGGGGCRVEDGRIGRHRIGCSVRFG